MFVKGLEKGTLRAAGRYATRPAWRNHWRKKKPFNLAVSMDVLQGPQAYMMKFSFLVTWSNFELLEKAFALEILLTQERFSKLSTM